MDVDFKMLEKINKAGVGFTVHLFDVSCILSPEQVIEYVKDPELFEANFHKVDIETWRKFKEHYSDPRCSEFTKKGTPCRGFVRRMGFKEFLEKDCESLCVIHSR